MALEETRPVAEASANRTKFFELRQEFVGAVGQNRTRDAFGQSNCIGDWRELAVINSQEFETFVGQQFCKRVDILANYKFQLAQLTTKTLEQDASVISWNG